MKNGALKWLLAALIILLPALAWGEAVQQPQHTEGDTWYYEVTQSDWVSTSTARLPSGIYEVVYRRDGLEISLLVGERREKVSANLDIFLDLLGMENPRSVEDPRIETPLLKFPFSPGDEWSGRFKPLQGTGMTNVTHKASAAVETKTPNGTLIIYPIVRNSGGQYTATYSEYSYSPEMKSIIFYSRETRSARNKGVIGRTLIKLTNKPAKGQ